MPERSGSSRGLDYDHRPMLPGPSGSDPDKCTADAVSRFAAIALIGATIHRHRDSQPRSAARTLEPDRGRLRRPGNQRARRPLRPLPRRLPARRRDRLPRRRLRPPPPGRNPRQPRPRQHWPHPLGRFHRPAGRDRPIPSSRRSDANDHEVVERRKVCVLSENRGVVSQSGGGNPGVVETKTATSR